MEQIKMEECNSFNTCSAQLCPLDPDLKLRVWYISEDVCAGRAGSGVRWIKKMRTYNRNKPKTYMDKPLSYQLLYDNSRPRVMSPAQREALRERGRKLALSRHKGKIKSTTTMV
jgi:hypothetical protein